MADWRAQLLRQMGMPITPQNMDFLQTWQRYEGGHTNNAARFNWLNTTRNAPGATGSINQVGVKAFATPAAGIAATAATLGSGRYGDIVSALQSGNPFAHNLTSGLSTWVSGSPTGGLTYAQKIMGGAVPPSSAPPAAVATTAPQSVRTRRGPSPLVQSILQSASQRDPRAQTMSIMGALLAQREPRQIPPPPTSSSVPGRPLAAASPPGAATAGGGGNSLAQIALGGSKFSNLGGPDAHAQRPLGNWQSDNAWDLGVPVGTPLYAVADGVIGPRVGPMSSRQGDGSRFTLVGKNNQFWYGHLSRLAVRPGQQVKRGQLVGYSGQSRNGVPHLHLGVERP